jgi:hypothetical protein
MFFTNRTTGVSRVCQFLSESMQGEKKLLELLANVGGQPAGQHSQSSFSNPPGKKAKMSEPITL